MIRATIAITIALLGWFGADAAQSEPQSLRVASEAELAAALAELKTTGGVVAIAPGTYDRLHIPAHDWSTPLTVRAADPNRPPTFKTEIRVERAANVTIEDVRLLAEALAPSASTPRVVVRDARDILLDGVEIVGRPVVDEGLAPEAATRRHERINGFPYEVGLSIRQSDRVRVMNATISKVRVGVFLKNVTDVRIEGSTIHDVRADGVVFSDARRLEIVGNRFFDFNPWSGHGSVDGDHADMIQFWGTRSDFGIDGVTISGNELRQGSGRWTQAIFGHMGSGDRDQVRLKGFEITDNLIVNGHIHGVFIGDVDGAVIEANILAPSRSRSENSTSGLPRIALIGSTRNVSIRRNFSFEPIHIAQSVPAAARRTIRIEDDNVVGSVRAARGRWLDAIVAPGATRADVLSVLAENVDGFAATRPAP